MKHGEPQFSRIRSFFWPVHNHELTKFIPTLLLFFLISFNYHFLRISKDPLIITAPESGVETLPFLKVWAVLPTAFIITFFYTRLANYFNRENIFYVIISFFLLFYLLFLLVLYPNRETLCLHEFADYLQTVMPKGFNGLIAIVRYWIFALFYVMSESWSNIMLSLLLWGFANDVTSFNESRRFYPLLGIGINSSGILAGKVGFYLSTFTLNDVDISSSKAWDQTLTMFISVILACGIASIVLYRWLHLYAYTNRNKAALPLKEIKKKEKMSLRNSFSYILQSKYLISLAIIVLSYNLVINLTEVLWKSQIKELFPKSNDYTAYMSSVTFYVGIIATLTSYFISGNIIRSYGWKFAAYITPVIILSTGVAFFYFLFIKQYSTLSASVVILMGMSPLTLTVFFGTMQNCLSRSAKYTVFDDTKEMAFIPLSAEARFKGKTAIDGIGSRLGKSGGSLLLQGLLIFFSTPTACIPYITAITILAICAWFKSIGYLGKKLENIKIETIEDIPNKK